MDKKTKKIYAAVVGADLAIIYVVAATIVSELYKPYKNWLAVTFNHHWIGKGAIAVIIFILVALIKYVPVKKNKPSLSKAINTLAAITLIGFVTLIGFFVYETFNH